MPHSPGRHFLQIPGPSNVPDRVLRAMDMPTIDHRGPDFAALTLEILEDLKQVFKTSGDVIIYPASGTGAWEAALVNTLSPGDRVLMFETGHFATLWRKIAGELGLEVEFVAGDWRHGADPAEVEARLAADESHSIKAVMVVHNETSTGVTSRIGEIRRAIDRCGHPALLMVDIISSLGSIDYRHDEWGVDVTVAGSQKGLMLPPGLSFNAISDKALRASETSTLNASYWRWQPMLERQPQRLLSVYAGHQFTLRAARSAAHAARRGPGTGVRPASSSRRSDAPRGARLGTGDPVPEPGRVQQLADRDPDARGTRCRQAAANDSRAFRHVARHRARQAAGASVFRIGHLGDFNDLMLAGTLCGVEMGLAAAGIPFTRGGVNAALAYLEAEGAS